MLKHFAAIAAVIAVCSCSAPEWQPQNPAEEAAAGLAGRVLPARSADIEFHLSPAGTNFYRYECKDGRLVIEGDCANSMAMGLGDYLRDVCLLTPTWYRRDALKQPHRLPATDGAVERKALAPNRFFLNYCTYGYSLNWWKWEDWEGLIDWMAMNGVTMALATTGQESVWLEVWKQFGLDEDQIRSYFTGPSYLSWHRMTNVDGWHGPLPMSWLDGQMELQKKIIEREVSLGISPILSAFSGRVPKELRDVYPDADIKKLNAWGDFEEQYNPWYLNPSEPLYKEIQKAFLAKQKEIYGQDSHVYGIDLFNEVEPPSWDPDYLGKIAANTWEVLSESDPDAVWLQMAWMFYYKRKQWTPETIEAYLTPVPKGHLLMLDYWCEKAELYKTTDNFYGQDFIWSYLGNFGGNTMIAGPIKDVSAKLDAAVTNPCFTGVGCTLEGLDVNPEMYEYVLSRAWERNTADDAEWFEKLADRHFGKPDEANRKAWAVMYDKVLREIANNSSGLVTARPAVKARVKWHRWPFVYDTADLAEVWKNLAEAGNSSAPSFRFDCVNVARQTLDNMFSSTRDSLLAAFKAGELESVRENGEKMLGILDDLDALLASDSYFLLGKWISNARSWGLTPEEEDYYETDARDILTCWGGRDGRLVDYANRDWNGLISSYYKVRWAEFIKALTLSLEQNTEFDEDAYQERMRDFEWDWISDRQKFISEPQGNPVKLSARLYRKYFGE